MLLATIIVACCFIIVTNQPIMETIKSNIQSIESQECDVKHEKHVEGTDKLISWYNFT